MPRLRFDIASDSVKTFASPKYEVIEDGREGVPVSGSDPIALADAIEGLLRDPDRRARMVRAAADEVCRCYDVRSCETTFYDRLRGGGHT
jgi:glycosyltransferase involved in cell wall biosynthesis